MKDFGKFSFAAWALMALLLAGCSGETGSQSAPVDSLAVRHPLPQDLPAPNGPKVVLPLTEQSPLELVMKRYAEAGLKVDSVVKISNPLKGIVLKAQWGQERVREGDSVPVGATLRLWVGE